IVFIINSFNLVDGINGLAALLGIAALISFGLWLYIAGKYNYVIFVFTIIASLSVFLRFNLFNTKAFLGDNGSMLIGFLASYLAIVFINTYTDLSNEISTKCEAEIGIVFAAMAIPVADTLRLFILRPYYLKKSPFKADRNHVHHLLLRLGFNHAEASLFLFGFAIFLVIVSLPTQDLGSLAVILITLFLSMALMMSLDYFVFSKFKRRIAKKTMFNSLQNISKDLNYPIFIEYAFATSFFILAMAIPFHRVSTSIPTLILLFSFLTLIIRTLIVYRSTGWQIIQTKINELLKHPYSILLLFNLAVIVINIITKPNEHWTKIALYSLPLVYWITVSQLERIIEIKPRFLLTAYILGLTGFGVYILIQSFVHFPEYGWNSFFYRNLLFHVKANPVTHS
ncbi:MAG: undecaprenyl/decaprenyl-phosphate alpha-N-acetylglucosaminyl 1-phosphate transferase, partial [Bacteroidetes bacterium]|nr:undecaprenyl/decaprenyl-phosphate alpha-N-acetylglucosaminyl 1-phosphate transferase [Bacteroidota bacterium]